MRIKCNYCIMNRYRRRCLFVVVNEKEIFILKKDLHMKKPVKSKTWIKILFIIEILVVLFLIATSFGKRHEYKVDFNSFYLEYDNVSITEDGNIMILATENNESSDESSATDDVLFYSEALEIAGGVYDVYVDYQTDMSAYGEIDVVGGYLSCLPEPLQYSSVKASDNKIIFGQTESHGRYWIKSTFGEQSVQLQYTGTNSYNVLITDITLKENLLGRVWRVLSFIFIFLSADLLVFIFAGDYYNTKQKQTALLVLVFAAGASLLSFSDTFYLLGDDLKFHLQRIVSIANELSYGQFPVRMQSDMLNGYGYGNSLFYPDLFLYIPAVLYNLTVPLSVCMQIYIILINLATAWISYWVFNKIFKSCKLGILGSGLYTLSAYRLYNIYTRCALGEFTAMAFYPLVILGIYNILKSEGKLRFKDYLPLVIGMSCIIESHILSCYIVCIALVIYVLINVKQFFVKDKLIAIVKSAILTMLVNAAFLIPFLDSYSMNILVKNTTYDIQQDGLDLISLFSLFYGKRTGDGENIVRSAGLVFLLGLIIYLLLFIKKDENKLKEYNAYKYCNKLVVLSIIFIVLSSKYFPYERLASLSSALSKITGIIQFSWRFLGLISIVLCVVFLCGISLLYKTDAGKYVNSIICIAVVLTVVSTYYYYHDGIIHDYSNEAVDVVNSRDFYYKSDLDGMEMVVGQADYWLGDSSDNLYITYLITNPEVSDENLYVTDWRKDGDMRYLTVSNTGDVAYVIIPVLAYDNYEAYDDNYNFPMTAYSDYRICIEIPAGYTGTITISYEKPFLWAIAEIISYITILIMAFHKTIFKKKSEWKEKAEEVG